MAFLSGTQGNVTLGGSTFKFAKWRISMRNGLPRVNNFTSAYQELVLGLTSATITLEGPYDSTLMPMTTGASYAVVLYWIAAGLSLSVTARIGELTPDNNVEDAPRISVVLESAGSFTAAVT